MKENIINKIMQILSQKLAPKQQEIPHFPNKDYKAIPISENNFHKITSTNTDTKIAFVDGGNAEILKATNFSLQFIRIFGIVFQKNKKLKSIKKEFYLLTYSEGKENKINYKCQLFPNIFDQEFTFDSYDPSIKHGLSRASISVTANIIRRFAELHIAQELIDHLTTNDIILLDGTLQCTYSHENLFLERLYQKAINNNITITALAKTSQLFTNTGNSLIGLINKISPKGIWYYHPIVEINNELHKSNLYLVKLNNSSKYVFRFEVFKNQSYNINHILNTLVENSKDLVFAGYPYGLILADKFARVSNNEIEYLKTKFNSSSAFKELSSYIKTTDAHDVLDNIS